MSDPRLMQALLAWRQDQLDSGCQDWDVPLPGDLEVIASTPSVNRAMLDKLQFERADLVLLFAPGVLSTLRAARRAVEVGTTPAMTGQVPPAATAPGSGRPGRQSRSGGAEEAQEAGDAEPGFFGWSSGPVSLGDPTTPAAMDPAASTAPATPSPPESHSSTAEPVAPTSRRQSRRRLEAGAEPARVTLRTDGFALFDLALAAPVEVPRPRTSPTGGAGVRLTWDAVEGAPTVLYRVVSRDDFDVWSPDDADVVAVTPSAEAVDESPFLAAVRFYAVYVHTGRDEAAARAAQPRLLVKGEVVAPPSRLRLEEDHGTVFVSWHAAREVERVEVLRVPSEHAHASGYQRRFSAGEARGRNSFQDDGCEPGQEYEYRLFAVWTDPVSQQQRMSDPAIARVRVRTVLTPVRQLSMVERTAGDRVVLDLAWDQPPRNDVWLYRTPAPPATGAGNADLDVSALPGAGLTEEHRLRAEPVVDASGRATLTGLAWPQGWPRVHVTLVSVGELAARIGDTATLGRTSEVRHVRIVERVEWQLLTFSWPVGAVSVSVLTTPRGKTLDDFPGSVVAELSEADYRRNGGSRLALPAEGCDVHLVPKSFLGRRQVTATPTTESYPGLFIMRYHLEALPAPERMKNQRGRADQPPPALSTWRRVLLWGDGRRPAEQQVTLSLVARRDRMPLSLSDGEVTVAEQRIPLPEAAWQELGTIDLAAFAGSHLRMFATAEGLELALLDPALASLRP